MTELDQKRRLSNVHLKTTRTQNEILLLRSGSVLFPHGATYRGLCIIIFSLIEVGKNFADILSILNYCCAKQLWQTTSVNNNIETELCGIDFSLTDVSHAIVYRLFTALRLRIGNWNESCNRMAYATGVDPDRLARTRKPILVYAGRICHSACAYA